MISFNLWWPSSPRVVTKSDLAHGLDDSCSNCIRRSSFSPFSRRPTLALPHFRTPPKKKTPDRRLNWKKSFLLLGIKFRGHAKEEAKQQPATWMDFLTRKKLRQKFTSFIPSHIRKTAAGFLAINKAYY